MHLVDFIVRIYHEAQSSKRQIRDTTSTLKPVGPQGKEPLLLTEQVARWVGK